MTTHWLDLDSLTEDELRRAVNALAAAENHLVNADQTGFDPQTFREMKKKQVSYSEALGRLIEKRYEHDLSAARKRFDSILESVQKAMNEWEYGSVPDFSLVIEHGALEDIIEKEEREQKRIAYEKEKADKERARKEEEALAKGAQPEIRLEL